MTTNILVQNYNDTNLIVTDTGLQQYSSNDGEVLSGGGPVPITKNFTNCVLKCSLASILAPVGTNVDNQFSWTPPTWPAWDALQSAFAEALLSIGINTPPEPGNPPYTSYATGLWNSPRIGIGAMDFPAATTTAAPITPRTPRDYITSDSHGSSRGLDRLNTLVDYISPSWL
jgi:hypothetical protein